MDSDEDMVDVLPAPHWKASVDHPSPAASARSSKSNGSSGSSGSSSSRSSASSTSSSGSSRSSLSSQSSHSSSSRSSVASAGSATLTEAAESDESDDEPVAKRSKRGEPSKSKTSSKKSNKQRNNKPSATKAKPGKAPQPNGTSKGAAAKKRAASNAKAIQAKRAAAAANRDDDDDDSDAYAGSVADDEFDDGSHAALDAQIERMAEEGRAGDDARDADVEHLLDALGNAPDGKTDGLLTTDTLKKLLAAMKEHWTSRPTPGVSPTVDAAERFGVREEYESGKLNAEGIAKLKTREMYKRCRIETAMRRAGMMDIGAGSSVVEEAGAAYETDLAHIMNCIMRAHNLLYIEREYLRAVVPGLDNSCPASKGDPFTLMSMDFNKLDDYQALLVFLLRALQDKGYRRYNEACYEEIIAEEKDEMGNVVRTFPTHAWRRACDIKEFIMRTADKETHQKQWQSTTGRNLNLATTYLTECIEKEFPQLHPDRHLHAFKNGIYKTNVLVSVTVPDENDPDKLVVKDMTTSAFWPWGCDKIPRDAVACKYHPYDFDPALLDVHWSDVPTPSFHQVLEYQMKDVKAPRTKAEALREAKMTAEEKEAMFGPRDKEAQDEVMTWIYTLMGRLLFEVGELDEWQVIPFVVGRAGTGKSKILKTVGYFFNEEDVGTLANNAQKGFGLETMYDKHLWRCFEVKTDFSLDQGQMQSMVSGEDVSVMRKNKVEHTLIWRAPGILAGNEAAAWVDNSGSISRRILMIMFGFRVDADKSDPMLDAKIKAEMPRILHKCCTAYLTAVNQFAHKDLWGTYDQLQMDEEGNPLRDAKGKPITCKRLILPAYFHTNKKKLQQATHPLTNWLTDAAGQSIEFEKGCGMSWDRFKELANLWMAANGMQRFSWKEDKYKTVLEDFKLERQKLERVHLAANPQFENGKEVQAGTDWVWNIKEKDHEAAAKGYDEDDDDMRPPGGDE